ncbi:MAG: BrnT family toxin [Deltaproteobacteria bacterium]|nr:BrnT family toxin [Deltaproteobacteria bacterium]MBW2098807.1 BrnT family toxin [Deltaproteobacteria bacterium]
MKFEWDEKKSRSNKDKHGIDFQTATQLWSDADRIKIETPYPLENRYILIGKLDEKHWTAVFSKRGQATRIISVHRARRREVALYEEYCQK